MSSQPRLNVPLFVKYVQFLGEVSHILSALCCTSAWHLNVLSIEQNEEDLWLIPHDYPSPNECSKLGINCLVYMDDKDMLIMEEKIEFIKSCWDEEAGLFES